MQIQSASYLSQLADASDGPALLDQPISDGANKRRHCDHGHVGDEGEEGGGVHREPQCKLKVGGQPGQEGVVAVVVAEVSHNDGPDCWRPQELTPGR